MTRMSPAQILLAKHLFEAGAIKDKTQSPNGVGFALKNPSLPLSPMYVDLGIPDDPKPGPVTTDLLHEIIRFLFQMTWCPKPLPLYQHIAGVPRGGDPYARGLCAVHPKHLVRLLRLDKEEMPDGTRRVREIVEGKWIAGDTVLLIEDVLSTGQSTLEAIGVIEAHRMKVAGILVIVDREQGGREHLSGLGYSSHSALNLVGELLPYYEETGMVPPGACGEIRAYAGANKWIDRSVAQFSQ